MTTIYPVGTKVVDRGGYKGTITRVYIPDEDPKVCSYEVRLERGYVVRWGSDLTVLSQCSPW